MEWAIIAYLVGVLTELKTIITIFPIFGLVGLTIFGVIYVLVEEKNPFGFIWFRRAIYTTCIIIFISIFIPSSDVIKNMIGGYIAHEVYEGGKNLEGLSDLPQNMIDLVNNYVNELNEEFKKEDE